MLSVGRGQTMWFIETAQGRRAVQPLFSSTFIFLSTWKTFARVKKPHIPGIIYRVLLRRWHKWFIFKEVIAGH